MTMSDGSYDGPPCSKGKAKWKPNFQTRDMVAAVMKVLRRSIKEAQLESLKSFNRGRLAGVMLAAGNDRPLPGWMYRTKGGV